MPKAKNLVNSTTAYAYDLRTQTYLQPAFAYQTLQRMHTVNAHLLGQLQMQHDLVLEKQTVPAGTSISDLIQVAIKEKSKVHSPIILDTVMKELETQTLFVFLLKVERRAFDTDLLNNDRTPVLFAVDDFQALYCKTEYRDPHFAPIKSFHLSMPRLIMDFASGKRSFVRPHPFVGPQLPFTRIYLLGEGSLAGCDHRIRNSVCSSDRAPGCAGAGIPPCYEPV